MLGSKLQHCRPSYVTMLLLVIAIAMTLVRDADAEVAVAAPATKQAMVSSRPSLEDQPSKTQVVSPSLRSKSYKSGGEQPQYKYRYYYWGDVSAGNCHQINGTLMFRSDGNGTFDATVWTDHTHSGDIWHSYFTVYDNDNLLLFSTSQMDSPNTYGSHVPMHGVFTFPANKFGSLPTKEKRVWQNSSC